MTSDPAASNWALAQLKPNGLGRALENLCRQGFDTFMPLKTETTRTRTGQVTKSRPLFPGYLFVDLSASPVATRKINATLGVARLVSLGSDAPARVPIDVIEGLRSRCDALGYFLARDQWSAGDSARVISGPFAQLIGEIEDIPEQGRVYMLMDLMGRSVRAEIACRDLEPAP